MGGEDEEGGEDGEKRNMFCPQREREKEKEKKKRKRKKEAGSLTSETVLLRGRDCLGGG